MARPELKSPADLGIKPEPTAKPTPAPKQSLYHRLKHAGGEMTILPARQADEYLTDAVKGMKK